VRLSEAASRRALSLTHQNAWRLALVFIAFEGLLALAVVFLLMLPMARRAAGDLAGIMVLSAQTLSELPPDTRPVFAQELRHSHQLVLAARAPEGTVARRRFAPFLDLFAEALRHRLGREAVLLTQQQGEETWHWVALPSGAGSVWVGFSHGSRGPQPLTALALSLAIGLLLAVLAAWWLAHVTVAPLRKLDAAAAELGRGQFPASLPEAGPRELAALTHRFNAMAAQVRDLLEARTTLLAGLSHDLRTPLARMRLALEMLARRPDPAWIERIDQDIGAMDQLVGELLELARGFGSETAVATDLGALLEDMAAQARSIGADVRVEATSQVLAVPPASLRRVLGNLLDNAQRYAGGPIVMRGVAGASGYRIGVLDSGSGIPEDQLEAVFRPFHRVEGSRNTATGGTGLGLAIVRQLSQAHGWHIELGNRPEGGLAAWLHLPAQVDSLANRR